MTIAAKVAQDKEQHPERFCPTRRCLWRTGDGGHCPRHRQQVEPVDRIAPGRGHAGLLAKLTDSELIEDYRRHKAVREQLALDREKRRQDQHEMVHA